MKNQTSLITRTIVWLALATNQSMAQPVYEPYTFTTLAGRADIRAHADGIGSTARFNQPYGVAVDRAGNIYVADTQNATIRKVTPTGVVATLAGLAGTYGSTDGTGIAARFSSPYGVATDSAGNIYVVDSYTSTIRKVTPAGVVTTLAGLAGAQGSADGTGSAARFNSPQGIAVDNADNVYVADTANNTIRKVTSAGVVTTLAGLPQFGFNGYPEGGSADGTGSDARFDGPWGLAVDSGSNVYVADYYNHTIRRITPVGVVTTLAGLAGASGSADGTGNDARFWRPSGVAVDGMDNVYVADSINSTIRKVTPEGEVTTLAGLALVYGSTDGMGSDARFYYPYSVAADRAGNIYVADFIYESLRKVTAAGVVTTLAGPGGNPGSADGTGSGARFYFPSGVAEDNAGNIYVADHGNNTIRKATSAGVVTTLAGLAGVGGSADGTGSQARFIRPTGLALSGAGDLFVVDSLNHTIRRVTPSGAVTTLAGEAGNYLPLGADGTGSAARFYYPAGLAVDSAGTIFVADYGNDTIRKVTTNGVVTTLAGLASYNGSADGTGSDARFDHPSGVAVDSAGILYVADTGNYTIRKITSPGVVTTLAGLAGTQGSSDGAGSDARFWEPTGVAVDYAGNVYVADVLTIRKVTPAGVVTTLGGKTFSDLESVDGTGSEARFGLASAVSVNTAGNIYVADWISIRKGIPASAVPAPSLSPPSLSAGRFGLGLSGLPGLALDVESSVDLLHWQIVGTYVLESGTNYFVSPTPILGNQFYRGHVR